jgi:hypothetical protein
LEKKDTVITTRASGPHEWAAVGPATPFS